MDKSDHPAALRLAYLLASIEANDEKYGVREYLVYAALSEARQAGFPAGIRIDPQEPEWPVAFIELPTGQVSWHLSAFPDPWDGHSTPEKFDRIRKYIVGLAK